MVVLKLVNFCGLFSVVVVLGVPASSDSNSCENVASEVTTVKNTLKVLSDQWDKWNTLFITSLEPRITSTAATLSSIDSNIHNLQERAHVWDTFQLHVAAWNDQLASLDRKMAILSKGMEQVLVIDSKLNAMLSAEYKLDTIIKMVNSLTGSILNIKQFCKSSSDSLMEEFAVRGILSSLKLVERKVDKLLIARPTYGMKTVPEGNQINCHLPKATEDLLNDISSKVDIIFDSVYKKNENDYPEDYLEVKDVEGSGDSTVFPINIERYRAVNKGSRHFAQNGACCKYTDHGIKEIKELISSIEQNVLSCAKLYPNRAVVTPNVCDISGMEDMVRNVTQGFLIDQTINMESYFNEHTAQLSSMLQKFSKKSCANSNANGNYMPTIERENDETATLATSDTSLSTEENVYDAETVLNDTISKILFNETNHQLNNTPPTSLLPKVINKGSCDDLDDESTSGIYIFLNSLGDFFVERFFNKHYCEVRDDGLWTVIQRRDNYSYQHDFNVSWKDYKLGFGDLNEDFWMGNNFLARISKDYNLTLRIELGDFDGNEVWAEYRTFNVDTEDKRFKLTIAGYSGNSSDALSSHNGAAFSTYDRKNDEAPECCPCSLSYGGGWWFTRCFESNLNGIYYRKPYENEYFRGLIWEHWLGNYSLKRSRMMIKSTGMIQLYKPDITRIEDP